MSETIGQKLRRSREEKRIGLDQACAATRIRPHYLEALERDDLSAIPSAAQARGFLRIYADFLGLNADELIPAARPPEPVALTPPSADLSAAPVQEAVAPSAPARPNLLASLRERFARRRAENNVDAASGDDRQPVASEPEFAPARYTEELPAEPAPVVIEEPAIQEPTKPAKRSPARKNASAKKPAQKQAGIFSRAKKSAVKKKMTGKPRPKRDSLPPKPSSSPANRASKNKPIRKPKKRA